jgi:hypothetical protein
LKKAVCTLPTMHAGEPTGDRSGRGAIGWAQRFLIVVLVTFTLAAVGNIAMEASYKPATRGLMFHDDGSLSEATATDPTIYRGRYWIASIVHDVAFGGTVVVPDRALIEGYRFRNLADVEIKVEEYDPELTGETVSSLEGLPSVQGLGNIIERFDFKPFRVVWSDEGLPVPVLRLWYFGEMMYFIDDRVLTPGSDR